MTRKTTMAASAVAALIVLSGCGGGSETSTAADVQPVELGVPLPDELSNASKLEVGVACDYPPFGFLDIENKNAGYDADVARALAKYAFGTTEAVSYTCVTPANRIAYLNTDKVDLLISTLGYTAERDKTIDYSTPYFTSGAKMLVQGDSDVSDWADIKGKTVITKQGTTSSLYLQQCFKDSEQLALNGTSNAVTALEQKRGVAFVEDSTLLLGLSLTNEDVKVVGEDRATTPWGIGIRDGDAEMKAWVDAALADMKAEDTFYEIFQENVTSEEAQKAFSKSMPRPDVDLEYSADASFEC